MKSFFIAKKVEISIKIRRRINIGGKIVELLILNQVIQQKVIAVPFSI